MDTSSNVTHGDIENAEILNNYFSCVVINEPLFDQQNCVPVQDTDHKLDGLQLSVDQVKNKDLDPDKSCGPDLIHPNIPCLFDLELALPSYMIFTKLLVQMKIPIQ